MKITGYKLMDRLEELKELARTVDTQFKPSLFKFETDKDKPDPRALMALYSDYENRITLIQEAQAEYNLRVFVEVMGERMTLHRVVRTGSVIGRLKNQWRAAATEGAPAYYSGYNSMLARDKEHEYAQRVVDVVECNALADAANKQALAYKQAVRAGNATEIELELDPGVFE